MMMTTAVGNPEVGNDDDAADDDDNLILCSAEHVVRKWAFCSRLLFTAAANIIFLLIILFIIDANSFAHVIIDVDIYSSSKHYLPFVIIFIDNVIILSYYW